MNKLLLLALIAIFLSMSGAHAEISKEKRKEVETMLRLTGMEKLMAQIKTQMISGLQAQMKQVPESFWEKFQEKMDTRELLEKLIPLYDKYYTIEDLKAVNAFYASPAGQKVLSTLPQIMQESMKLGQEWGERIGKQAAEEAAKELEKK
jgi:hypothetical protein